MARILIVEDEYLIADDLRRLLTSNRYTVAGPVASTDLASMLIAQRGIDFAVLDINLNGEMSFGIAAELRAAGIPFLFLTGYDRHSIPSLFEEEACLLKPHEPALVVQTIGRMLATPGSLPSDQAVHPLGQEAAGHAAGAEKQHP